MNITKQEIDALNAIIKVDIAQEDYKDKVQKVLKDYRKTANIPGFRKGQVPMGLIQKQYGKAVLVDEVNKLLQDALNKYLTEEKLDVLGNPLPKEQEDFDWDAEAYSFEFELGMAPEFDINLKPKKGITYYQIEADDTMVENQIKTIRKQYGKLISETVATIDSEVTGTFFNEAGEIDKESTFEIALLKGKKNQKLFINTKVDDVITISSKGLFSESKDYTAFLGKTEEEAKKLNVELTFTIKEVNKREMADLDQELFDKLFGKDVVKTATELKAKIKEDSEKQFVQHSDQQLLNDVTEHLIAATKFDLPSEFLQRWIQSTGESEMTLDEAKEEYERSEKGLRYQLIEGKLVVDNNLQVTFDELKDYAKEMIKGQMMQFGQMNPEDKELEDIAARILGNQDEVKRLSEQLRNQKMLSFFKENVSLKEKKVTFDEFVKEVYK